MQLGSSSKGYFNHISLWNADVKDLHCIKLDTPDSKGQYSCDCYKKRVEFLHDLNLVKLDICRGWWDYMIVQTDFFCLFEKMGFSGFSRWECFFNKGMQLQISIQCHRDIPIYQSIKLYDLLSDEYIYRLGRLSGCVMPFYNSSNVLINSMSYRLKGYINECMKYKKLTTAKNIHNLQLDINKRIKMLIEVINEMTEKNS